MTQTSLPWDGKLVGDSGPYNSDRWSAMYRNMSPDTASSAVLWSTTSENLKATISGGSVAISEGSAMVYGHYYNNSAEESFAIPAAATDRTDMIVLRATWGSTKAVRLAYLTGTSGSVTPPTLTQTAGTVWEVPLYEIDALAGTIRRDRRSLWQACTLIYRNEWFNTGMLGNISLTNLPGIVSKYLVVLSSSGNTMPGSIVMRFNGVTGNEYFYSIDGAAYTYPDSVFYVGAHDDSPFLSDIEIYPNYNTEAGVGWKGVTAIARTIGTGLPTTTIGGYYDSTGSVAAGLSELSISANTGTMAYTISVYAFS